MNEFFELDGHVNLPGTWYLDDLYDSAGQRFDERDFTYGLPIELGPPMRLALYDTDTMVDVVPPLMVTVPRDGTPTDYTLAGIDMPVITRRVGELLGRLAGTEIQRIPVRVDGHDEQYEILNVISVVPCIDTKRSRIMWWTEADGRPDKVGQPRMISKFVLDRAALTGHNILIPKEWRVVVLVSEVLKVALEEAGVTGVRFLTETEM